MAYGSLRRLVAGRVRDGLSASRRPPRRGHSDRAPSPRGGATTEPRVRCVCAPTSTRWIIYPTITRAAASPLLVSAKGSRASDESRGTRGRPTPTSSAAPRAQARSAVVRKVCLFFLVVASLVSLDASGPRRARARYSPSQPHTRRRDTAARSRRQRGPAAPLTRDTANGLALVGLFYWRWGAFDGPPPSKNAGSLR